MGRKRIEEEKDADAKAQMEVLRQDAGTVIDAFTDLFTAANQPV